MTEPLPPSCETGGEKEPCRNKESAEKNSVTGICEEFKIQVGVSVNKEEVFRFRKLCKGYRAC